MSISCHETESIQKNLLVTGFEPFGGSDINPACEAVQLLPNQINHTSIQKCLVPTSFERSSKTVLQAIEANRPSAIIMIGQAGGRAKVTPERIAVNIADCTLSDNDGVLKCNEPIILEGPNAYFDTLNAYQITKTMQREDYPIALSYTAGTFVCNSLFYQIAHVARSIHVPCGFIHVPFLPSQAPDGVPSMELLQIVAVLTRFIEILTDNPDFNCINH